MGGIFDPENTTERLSEITVLLADEAIWQNPTLSAKLLKEQKKLQHESNSYGELLSNINNLRELFNLSLEEGDELTASHVMQDAKDFAKEAKKSEVECLFAGEADGNNAFVEIHAGAGGTESHDWALMLLRMYSRWAERHRFKIIVMDEVQGEEVGVKSCTIKLEGLNAYGWCKLESGVHRLVRISPFNAQGKRQTSFASVWVYPEVDDNINIEILDKDLRIDTYRASGAGGQHINKTDSAVRITHIPTNIAVACQNDRSQHRNRAEAMAMLKSRLYELELKRRAEKDLAKTAQKTDNSWGNQIRSYVLQPYQMIKDLRSNYESSDTTGVLDGDLDEFMRANLIDSLGKNNG